jgi:NAD(P)-dependent dehydrogenase (short-subunit alcohol dehydrogenase family)
MSTTTPPAPSTRRDDRFAGKVALVVGAGTDAQTTMDAPGVGAAIGLVLARSGCRVGLVGQGLDGVTRTAALIRGEGGEAVPIQADMSEEAECIRAVDAVLEAFGRLDILVNNLGIRLSGRGVTDVESDEFDRVMAVNAKGLAMASKHAVPRMSDGGAIVNISSIGAIRPTLHTSIVYAASKGAVDSMTLVMALQLASRQIRVNGVCPGNIWTPIAIREVHNRGQDPDLETARERRRLLIPLQTEGTAWDIAATTAFLASDDARWITGQTILVDGGALLPAPASRKPTA